MVVEPEKNPFNAWLGCNKTCTRGSCIRSRHTSGFLLGKFVQSSDKVQDLHHVKACHMKSAAPGTVVRPVDAVAQPVRDGRAGTTHEVIKEVVHQLDNIHDGF